MKQIFTLAIAVTISVFSFKGTAQGVAVNTTGNKADTSAMLDVSSTTKGLLAPRMTAAQKNAIVTPATGLLVYQTDAPIGFYYYDGSAWVTLKGATGATGSQGPQGNPGAVGSTGAVGATGQGVPTGGTAGQVLTKINATDYNTTWTTPSSGSSATGSSPSGIPYSVSGATGAAAWMSPNISAQQIALNGQACVVAPTACKPSMTIYSYTGGNTTWNLYSVTPTTASATWTLGTVVGSCTTAASAGSSCSFNVATNVSAGTIMVLTSGTGVAPGGGGLIKAFSCQ